MVLVPGPAVGYEGTDLRVLVRIAPHAHEPRLSLVVDRSSCYAGITASRTMPVLG